MIYSADDLPSVGMNLERMNCSIAEGKDVVRSPKSLRCTSRVSF